MSGEPNSCPTCREPLSEGKVEVHGTTAMFLAVGISAQDLWWYDADGGRKSRQRIIPSRTGRPAKLCTSCGTLTVNLTTKLKATRGRGGGH